MTLNIFDREPRSDIVFVVVVGVGVVGVVVAVVAVVVAMPTAKKCQARY